MKKPTAADSREKIDAVLSWLPFVWGICFLAVMAYYTVRALIMDDWLHFYYGIKILEAPRFHWDQLLIRHNSAVLFWLRLLYLASLKFFHADVRFLVSVNALVVLLNASILGGLLRKGIKEKPWRGAAVCYGTLTAFSSVQWFVLDTGWGFMWLIIPTLLGLALTVHASSLSLRAAFACYFALAAAASLSMSDGLFLWIVLPILMADSFGNKLTWREAAIWATGTGTLLYPYLCHYDAATSAFSVNTTHSNLAQSVLHPGNLAVFFFCLLGGIAGQIVASLWFTLAVGVLFLSAFLVCVYIYGKARSRVPETRAALPWLVFGLFHLLAAGMIALARLYAMDEGNWQASIANSRYALISLYFLLSLAVAVYFLVRKRSASLLRPWLPGYGICRRFLLFAAAAGLLIHAAAFAVCCKNFVRESDYRHYSRTAVSLQDSVPIPDLDSSQGFFGLFQPTPRAELVKYHVLELISPEDFERMLQEGRERAGRGEWAGRVSAEAREAGRGLQFQGWVAGPFFGTRPDAVLAVWRMPGQKPLYNLFPIYASPLETLRAHDGRLRSGWTGGFPIISGDDLSRGILKVYAIVLDRRELLPLAPAEAN